MKMPNIPEIASLTRGLVGDTNFAILPNIPPVATAVLTIFAQLASNLY